MYISLDQAIEIHGQALKYRKGAKAGAAVAAEEAERCKASGDAEGYDIWLKVSDFIVHTSGDAEKTFAPH